MEEIRHDESMVIESETRAGGARPAASGGRPGWIGLQQRVHDPLADGGAHPGTDANDGAHADASCADAVG